MALNGMLDHVHLLIQSGSQSGLSLLMKNIKGNTSALLNDMTVHAEAFRWQEGYFAVTVTPYHLPRVQAYVQNQKQHHAEGTTYAYWEETGEATDPNRVETDR